MGTNMYQTNYSKKGRYTVGQNTKIDNRKTAGGTRPGYREVCMHI